MIDRFWFNKNSDQYFKRIFDLDGIYIVSELSIKYFVIFGYVLNIVPSSGYLCTFVRDDRVRVSNLACIRGLSNGQ